MRPKDFWRLHPIEWWWIAEAKKPPKMYGRMTESEVAELYRDTFGDEEQD